MCKETATLIEERHFLLRERNTMDKEGIRSEKSQTVGILYGRKTMFPDTVLHLFSGFAKMEVYLESVPAGKIRRPAQKVSAYGIYGMYSCHECTFRPLRL